MDVLGNATLSGIGSLTATAVLDLGGKSTVQGIGLILATSQEAETWNGSTSSWDTDGNWSDGTKPTQSGNVTFDVTSTVNCTLDTNVDVYALNITSGYTGTFDGDTFSFSTIDDFTFNGNNFLGGSGTWDINGNFSSTGTSLDAESSNWNLAKDVTMGAGTHTKGTGTITLDGDPGDPHSIDFGGNNIENLVVDGGVGGTKQLTGTFTADSISVNSGEFDSNGNNFGLAATGTITNASVIRMEGTETVSNATVDDTQGSVIYNNANVISGLPLGNSYFNLTFS